MQTDMILETTKASLNKRGIEAMIVTDRKAARESMLEMIPVGASVGCGGSATLRQIGILEELKKRGTLLVNPEVRELGEPFDKEKMEVMERLRRKAMTCDYFLSGTNALTADGRLVNIDGVGNRVAGMFFGPKRVIIPAGRNKIVPDLDIALDRVRHVISPFHTSKKTPRKMTPCVVTGDCNDCRSPERSCCVTTIIEGRPYFTRIMVILVDEDLGLGWDPSWPDDRIGAIKSEYEKCVFPVTFSSRALPRE